MSARVRQLSFLPRPSLEHGGDTRIGKRKIARPFDPKRSLHLILKSERARGEWSMLHGRHRDRIESLTRGMARQFRVTIDRRGYANVGNHLHLIVRAPGRREIRSFIRAITGAVAMLVTGARKGRSLGQVHPLLGAFWEKSPYSRIVSWGRDLEAVRKYIVKNLFEAAGLWDPRDRAADLCVLECKVPDGAEWLECNHEWSRATNQWGRDLTSEGRAFW